LRTARIDHTDRAVPLPLSLMPSRPVTLRRRLSTALP
jgi:hypothetical protein